MRLFSFLFLLFFPIAALAADDGVFLDAREAFRVGDAVKLNKLAQRFQRSPMEVYVHYYQLRLGLDKPETEAEVRAYLARAEDSPMIDRLRAEWLKQLGKKQRWDVFDAEYPRLINEDAELTCYALQSRRRQDEAGALREARGLWFSGKPLPDACGTLFDAAIASRIITPVDIWQRLRLALEAGSLSLAKALADKSSGEYAVSSAELSAAARDAEAWLEKSGASSLSLGQRTAVMYALLTLAKQSPELALAHWHRLAALFTETEQQYFYGWLGYEGARKQDVRAVQWFRQAGDVALSEAQSAWWVRAALRVQSWPEVLLAVNSMSAQQQRDPAWQYWKARALQATGKTVEARAIFAPLSREFNFYGQMATDELGSVMMATSNRYQPTTEDIAAVAALPGVQRTIALYRMDLRTEALKEWSWAVRNLNDRELLAAAEIARRNEMYDRAIGAASLTVNEHDFTLRYLAPYREALQEHIRDNGLDEAWVYGLMRQESRFVTAAKSNVGAAGLMQVMPSTARWIAKRLGLKSYRDNLIHQMDTNLKLGTYYMKTVLSWFDDSPVLASAAYNAGPGRARRWRGDVPLEGAIYAETIPFDETRDYVKKVMSNTVYYAEQFKAPQRSLKQRMGVVAAKAPENQQAIPDEK
ncbi:MAG: transglycosylase SLT domain-containing protein [Gallionella sp.]|nr:transglycosylase SLT domain-containing protein [Gallionella sp.]